MTSAAYARPASRRTSNRWAARQQGSKAARQQPASKQQAGSRWQASNKRAASQQADKQAGSKPASGPAHNETKGKLSRDKQHAVKFHDQARRRSHDQQKIREENRLRPRYAFRKSEAERVAVGHAPTVAQLVFSPVYGPGGEALLPGTSAWHLRP